MDPVLMEQSTSSTLAGILQGYRCLLIQFECAWGTDPVPLEYLAGGTAGAWGTEAVTISCLVAFMRESQVHSEQPLGSGRVKPFHRFCSVAPRLHLCSLQLRWFWWPQLTVTSSVRWDGLQTKVPSL